MNQLTKRQKEIVRLLETINPYLTHADTFDVLINPPRLPGEGCSVWVDRMGGGLTQTGIFLDELEVRNLNRSIASELGRQIDEEHPILMGELPFNASRVTAINYPITRTGPALCLRKPSSRLLTFDDYEKSGVLDGRQEFSKALPEAPRHGHRAMIEYAINAKWNILFAGAPQSGKTTFANAAGCYMRSQEKDRRIYLIEDLEELKAEALPDNILRVQPSEALGISESKLLEIGLRVRPDGIFIAELLRPQAAYNFFSAMNTGIQSSWTTIHANSAHDALIRCETLIEQVPGITVSPSLIASSIQLIVFITRLPNGRRMITEVARVKGAVSRGRYNLEYIDSASHDSLQEKDIAVHV